MSNRLSSIATSAEVQNYATGAAQGIVSNLRVANFLAPTVTVPSANFNYQSYSLQNAFRIPNAFRGVGGRATQIRTGGTNNAGVLVPYGLDYPLDQAEMNLPPEGLTQLLKNRAEITAQVAGLSWSNKVITDALTAIGSGTNKSAATSGRDYVDDIDEQILAVVKATGAGEMCPVRVLFGPTAFRRMKNHTSVKDRFKGAKKDIVNPTLDDLMGLLMANAECRISWATYDSAAEGATASNAFMLDTAVLIFCAAETPTTLDPSFMKTFRSMTWMTSGSYVREDGRGEVAKMDWEALPVVTNSSAAARLNLTA